MPRAGVLPAIRSSSRRRSTRSGWLSGESRGPRSQPGTGLGTAIPCGSTRAQAQSPGSAARSIRTGWAGASPRSRCTEDTRCRVGIPDAHAVAARMLRLVQRLVGCVDEGIGSAATVHCEGGADGQGELDRDVADLNGLVAERLAGAFAEREDAIAIDFRSQDGEFLASPAGQAVLLPQH